jgi:hypothetical protein
VFLTCVGSIEEAFNEAITALRTVVFEGAAFPQLEHEFTTAVLAPSRAARVMVSYML